MTKHLADQDKYVAVKGLEAALEVAAVLLKNDYEVHIELDDCDIYCVHYAYAKHKGFGGPNFYRITAEQVEILESQAEALE